MELGIGGGVMFLSASLAFFSAHQPVVGCFCLCATAVQIASVVKSWKTYRNNCEKVGKHPFDAD